MRRIQTLQLQTLLLQQRHNQRGAARHTPSLHNGLHPTNHMQHRVQIGCGSMSGPVASRRCCALEACARWIYSLLMPACC